MNTNAHCFPSDSLHPDLIFVSHNAIQVLLDSPFFVGYRHRRDDISEATEDTFTWIYDEQAPDYTRDTPNATTFPVWLEQAHDIFWIRGKAGSGKSTIMKRLVSDHRTKYMLSAFARGCEIYVASFFCYQLVKDDLENTIEGTLRSLLYQLISADITLAEGLLAQRSEESGRSVSWTRESLKSAVGSVIATALVKNKRLCFFIDGLDELAQGDQITFMDFLRQTHKTSPQVLLCVSSRPTLSLPNWISEFCELDMSCCNKRDILTYVTSRVDCLDLDEWVVPKIAEYAEGVFLWAVLVTQRLICAQMIEEEDLHDKEILIVCLAEKSLAGLIGKLLAKARGSNKWYFFRVAILDQLLGVPATNLALLTAARSTGRVETYEQFNQACDRTRKQIESQSAGLLYYKDEKHRGGPREETQNAWAIPQPVQNKISPWSAMSSHEKYTLIERRRRDLLSQPDLTRIERDKRGHITWLHRSVYEYVKESGEGFFDGSSSPSDLDVLNSLTEGRFQLLL